MFIYWTRKANRTVAGKVFQALKFFHSKMFLLLNKINLRQTDVSYEKVAYCVDHGGGGGSSIVKVPGDVPPTRVYFFGPLV